MHLTNEQDSTWSTLVHYAFDTAIPDLTDGEEAKTSESIIHSFERQNGESFWNESSGTACQHFYFPHKEEKTGYLVVWSLQMLHQRIAVYRVKPHGTGYRFIAIPETTLQQKIEFAEERLNESMHQFSTEAQQVIEDLEQQLKNAHAELEKLKVELHDTKELATHRKWQTAGYKARCTELKRTHAALKQQIRNLV